MTSIHSWLFAFLVLLLLQCCVTDPQYIPYTLKDSAGQAEWLIPDSYGWHLRAADVHLNFQAFGATRHFLLSRNVPLPGTQVVVATAKSAESRPAPNMQVCTSYVFAFQAAHHLRTHPRSSTHCHH